MSPSYKSLLAVALAGGLLTVLLILKSGGSTSDLSSPNESAGQISDELSNNINALALGLTKLSNSPMWQSDSERDWSQNLAIQIDIYRAAGLTNLAVHSKKTNQYYTRLGRQTDEMKALEEPLARVYKNQRSLRVLHLYKGNPAIILLEPIKTVANEIIGHLVGIKTIDENVLKRFHFLAKNPVVILRNGDLFASSSDSTQDIDSYNLIKIDWPNQLTSSEWQLSLVEKNTSSGSGLWMVILAVLIVAGTLFFVWQQIQNIQSSLKILNQTLSIDLPIAEQIKRLTAVQNSNNDVTLLECSQAIRTRLEQLSQQKKALAIDIRKLQESQDHLQKIKSNIENERDSAVAAPRLKSEFLSRMGDEITTPMKSVVSMLKLLSEYPFDPEPKQLLTIAKRSTRTLVNNLNNILDFSKLDANMLRLKPKQFSVRELVDELSSELSHFANEKGLSLQASSAPEMPELILADEYRIKQIIRNLLGNAIRFTKSGEVSLYADLTARAGTKLLRFTISDTGIGISPAAQKELFDSLEQTTKLSNSSFTGRLRLIVSKRLAELMGGEIGVISEVGEGSQFWFTIAYKE
jgi:signal transduction histidine kinase